MGKTRDLFKTSRDTKTTFQSKMGTIKDRNGMDLTEAEDIKKRWQEYIEEVYRKDLHEPDNCNSGDLHLSRIGALLCCLSVCQRMFKLPHNCTHLAC